MGPITVTMPMHEYEQMRRRIKELEKESIRNFIDLGPMNQHTFGNIIGIREDKIREFLGERLGDEL